MDWSKVEQQIAAIGADDSPIVTDVIFDATQKLVKHLQEAENIPPHDVYHLPDGHIIFEWQIREGVIYRIEVTGDGYELMVTQPGTYARFGTYTGGKLINE